MVVAAGKLDESAMRTWPPAARGEAVACSREGQLEVGDCSGVGVRRRQQIGVLALDGFVARSHDGGTRIAPHRLRRVVVSTSVKGSSRLHCLLSSLLMYLSWH